MENLFTFFSKDFQYAIGWTVIHSLWQATAIAFLKQNGYKDISKSNYKNIINDYDANKIN